jgi:hypothetical protein
LYRYGEGSDCSEGRRDRAADLSLEVEQWSVFDATGGHQHHHGHSNHDFNDFNGGFNSSTGFNRASAGFNISGSTPAPVTAANSHRHRDDVLIPSFNLGGGGGGSGNLGGGLYKLNSVDLSWKSPAWFQRLVSTLARAYEVKNWFQTLL